MQILIQGLGIIVLIICVSAFFFKKKEYFLACILLYNIILAVQYVLLSYYTEFIICILAIIKDIVYYVYSKKQLKPSVFVLIIFITLFVLSGIFTWENWFSIFIMFSTVIGTYASWQDNLFVLRLGYVLCSIFLILNYIFTGLYTNIIAEFLTLSSGLISIYIYHIKKNTRDKNFNSDKIN